MLISDWSSDVCSSDLQLLTSPSGLTRGSRATARTPVPGSRLALASSLGRDDRRRGILLWVPATSAGTTALCVAGVSAPSHQREGEEDAAAVTYPPSPWRLPPRHSAGSAATEPASRCPAPVVPPPPARHAQPDARAAEK